MQIHELIRDKKGSRVARHKLLGYQDSIYRKWGLGGSIIISGCSQNSPKVYNNYIISLGILEVHLLNDIYIRCTLCVYVY